MWLNRGSFKILLHKTGPSGSIKDHQIFFLIVRKAKLVIKTNLAISVTSNPKQGFGAS